MYPRSFPVLALVAAIFAVFSPLSTQAFMSPYATTSASASVSTTAIRPFSLAAMNAMGKKKKAKEDLSYLETRDMTREEMLELNKKNEDIMNMELSAMTGFSLILSLPILYLCWVAFFSD